MASFVFFVFAAAQTLERVKQIGPPALGSFPYRFTIAGNKLFFTASEDGIKNSLFVTSATEASTQKISPPNNVSASYRGR